MADEKTLRVSIDGSGAKTGADQVVGALQSVKSAADDVGSSFDRTQSILTQAWKVNSIDTVTGSLANLANQTQSTIKFLQQGQSALTQGWNPGPINTVTNALTQMSQAATNAAGSALRSLTSAANSASNALNSASTVVRGLASVLNSGTTATKSFASLLGQLHLSVQSATAGVSSLSDFIMSLNSKLGAAGAVFSSVRSILSVMIPVDIIREGAEAFFDATNRFQGFLSTMTVVAGSTDKAKDSLKLIFDLANRYGVDVTSLTNSFAKLAAAAKGTSLEGEKVNHVFEAVVAASSAMHLSTQDTTLVLYALQQMVSKGTISMEELRRQMAERFPGAMQLAAESMLMTNSAFQKMVSSGKISTAEFVNGFADAILTRFLPATEVSANSLLAAVNRMKTAWEGLLIKLVESPLTGAMKEAVNSLQAALNSLTAKNIDDIGNAFALALQYATEFVKSIDADKINKFVESGVKYVQLISNLFGLLLQGLEMIAPLIEKVGQYIDRFNERMNEIGSNRGITKGLAAAFTATGDEELANATIKISEGLDQLGMMIAAIYPRIFGGLFAKVNAEMDRFNAEQKAKWDQWGDQVERSVQSAHAALVKNLADFPDQVSRMMAQVPAARAQQIGQQNQVNDARSVVDAQALLDQAKQKYEVGLKLNDVNKQYNELVGKRNSLEKELAGLDATNHDNDGRRTSIMHELKGVYTDLLPIQKEKMSLDKQGARSQDEFTNALAKFKSGSQSAKLEYEDLVKGVDKLVPAEKEWIHLQETAQFAKWSEGRKALAKAAAEQDIADQKSLASLKEFLTTIDGLSEKNDKASASLKQQILDLQNGEKATHNLAVAEFDRNVALLQADGTLDKVRAKEGDLVDRKLASARASAEARDRLTEYLEVTKKYVDENDKEIHRLDESTKRMNERAQTLTLTKEQQDLNTAALREAELAQVNEAIAIESANADNQMYLSILYKKRDALQANVDAFKNMAAAEAAKNFEKTWVEAVDKISDKFADFMQTGVNQGWSAAFKKLWSDFTSWGLQALAKIAIQKIAVSIYPQLEGAFSQGNNGPFGVLGTLFGMNGGVKPATVPPIDTSRLQTSVNDITSQFESFVATLKQQKADIEATARSQQGLSSQADIDAQNLADFGNATQGATTALNGLSSASGQAQSTFSGFSQEFGNTSLSTQNLLRSFDVATNDITAFGASTNSASAAANSSSSFMRLLGSSSSDASQNVSDFAKSASDSVQSVDNLSSTMDEMPSDLTNFSGYIDEAGTGLNNVAKSSGGVVSGFGSLLSGIGGFVSQLFSMIRSIGGGSSGGAGNSVSSLLRAGGGGGGIITDAAGAFTTSSVGQAFGLSEAVGGSAGIAADAVGLVPGGVAADMALTSAGTTFMAAASTFAAAIPYIGIAIAVLGALGVFDHEPSPTRGRFQISPDTTGFEDNTYTHTSFGNLGFSDADTQQFSGQAAQVFNQVVAGALNAFQARFSAEQSDHFAQVLKTMTFDAFEGTFTTEDFLKQYGGKVLQQVVVAAFQELDPALSAVAAKFSGTADDIAKFANTLLAIYDASKDFGPKFRDPLIGALDGTQETADKVLALATAFKNFGETITGLGAQMVKLSSKDMLAFVDALGGADKFSSTLQYINENFTTSADKMAAAQDRLNEDFANLHLQVPQTHADFLKLLSSFDLTTEAGRKMYASVAALAPLFIEVHGTADQAAQSLSKVADSFAAIGRNALKQAEQPDTSPFAAAQFIHNTVNDVAHATYNLRDGVQPIIHDLNVLGVDALPRTDAGWRQMIGSINTSTEAGSKLKETMIALYGAWLTLDAALRKGADDFHHSAFFTPDEQRLYDHAQDMVAFNQASEQLGHTFPTTIAGFRSYVLHLEEVSHGTGAAAEAARAELAILYPLVPQILNYNDAIQQQADTIARAYEQITEQNDAFSSKLSNLGNLAGGAKDFGASLQDAVTLYQSEIDKLKAKIADALAHPTAYNQSQLAYVYEPQLQQANKLLGEATARLDEFTKLSTSYGADKAEQLFKLEEQYRKDLKTFAGNDAAISILTQRFNAQWADIVNGTKDGVGGVQQTIEDFIKSLDSLVDSSHGTLGQRLAIQLQASFSKVGELWVAQQKTTPGSAQFNAIQADIDKMSANNVKLAGYISDFNTYSAQYGDSIADQLVGLEQWRDQQKATLTAQIKGQDQLASALGVVDAIFAKEFKDIIDGSKGAGNALEDLKKKIRDFIDGLKTSDLSPLTPQQKLQSAKDLFESDLAKTKSGDTEAMGKLTDEAQNYLKLARDFYASSQAYTDIFNQVVAVLAEISNYQAPLPTTSVAAPQVQQPVVSPVSVQVSAPQPAQTVVAVTGADTVPLKEPSVANYTDQLDSIGSKLDAIADIERSAPNYTEVLSTIAQAVAAPRGEVDSLRSASAGQSVVPTITIDPNSLLKDYAASLSDATSASAQSSLTSLSEFMSRTAGPQPRSYEEFDSEPAESRSPVPPPPVVPPRSQPQSRPEGSKLDAALPAQGERIASNADMSNLAKVVGELLRALADNDSRNAQALRTAMETATLKQRQAVIDGARK